MESFDTQKAFVSYAIEQSIFDIGGSQLLEEVSNLLYEKYQCDITECYRHPNYLNEVLDVIYGKSHKFIIESIQVKLDEFAEVPSVGNFLTCLR